MTRYGLTRSAYHLMRPGSRSRNTLCGLRPVDITDIPSPPTWFTRCDACWDIPAVDPDAPTILQGPRMREVYDACAWLDENYNAAVDRHNLNLRRYLRGE